MASIRRLKKDIDCLTFAVVDDSLNCLAVGKSMDDISEIVQHIIDSSHSPFILFSTNSLSLLYQIA